MLQIAPVLLVAIVVPFIMLGGFFIIMCRVTCERDSGAPFECGFDPKSSARLPFSLRFFLLAVIFLIFDVEVALLFPIVFASYSCEKLITLYWGGMFIALLILGLFMEWKGGALDWVS